MSGLLVVVVLLGCSAGLARAGGPPAPAGQIRIGEIRGAEYFPETNRFVLYATEPAPGNSTQLYIDDVARLALAVLRWGDFAFSLEQEGDLLKIHYLPPEAGEVIRPILHWTTVEETLLFTDTMLKNLAQGSRVSKDLRTGPSEFFLCAQELEAWVESGRPLKSFPIQPYVTYFDLQTQYGFDGFQGVGFWFVNPRIVVKAASRAEGADPPRCVYHFTGNLTAEMEKLLTDRKVAAQFRRLRALLLLCKTFGWARSIFVPIDPVHLASFRCRERPNRPVPIRQRPIILGHRGKVEAIALRGGVVFSAGAGFALSAPPAKASPTGPVLVRGFLVEPAVGPEGRLLAIDLSGILGLRRSVSP